MVAFVAPQNTHTRARVYACTSTRDSSMTQRLFFASLSYTHLGYVAKDIRIPSLKEEEKTRKRSIVFVRIFVISNIIYNVISS